MKFWTAEFPRINRENYSWSLSSKSFSFALEFSLRFSHRCSALLLHAICDILVNLRYNELSVTFTLLTMLLSTLLHTRRSIYKSYQLGFVQEKSLHDAPSYHSYHAYLLRSESDIQSGTQQTKLSCSSKCWGRPFLF